MRSSTASMSFSCGIAEKQEAMSVSTTHRRPCQDSSMSTCKASCADRPGRNPKLHGKKSASKTGSSTIFAAACTIRSRTAGIDNGLCSSVPGSGSDVRLHHPPATLPGLINEHLQGVVRRPPRAEPEAARQEVRLEDRLKHDLRRSLHDPVTNSGNRQRPLLIRARLRDEYPPGGQRPVPAFPQLAGQLIKKPGHPVLLDGRQGGLVDARRAVIRAHLDPRAPQNITAADLVIQRVEPTPGIGLGRPAQRMLQGTDRIGRDIPARPRRGGTSTNGVSPQPDKPWGGGGVSEKGSGRSETVALCAPLCDRRWR